jgi:HPt (histidine-containing phosphotransfer) domain-containing protein
LTARSSTIFLRRSASRARTGCSFSSSSRAAYAATIAQAVVPGSDAASHDRARRVAYSLKSSSGQVGAVALAALAATVELAAANGAPDLAPKAVSPAVRRGNYRGAE